MPLVIYAGYEGGDIAEKCLTRVITPFIALSYFPSVENKNYKYQDMDELHPVYVIVKYLTHLLKYLHS